MAHISNDLMLNTIQIPISLDVTKSSLIIASHTAPPFVPGSKVKPNVILNEPESRNVT